MNRSKMGIDKQHCSKSTTADGGGADSKGVPSEAKGQPLSQGTILGDLEKRLRQGESAVWGGRSAPDGSAHGSHSSSRGGGSGDWWETGTRYAFQPRLSADKATVLSLVGAGIRRDGGVDFDLGGVPRGKGGGSVGGSQTGSRTHSVATGLGLTPSHQARQPHEGQKSSRELMRVVKVPESNPDHGKRVFFVA